jgi:xanthine dehydrogenase YagR molybdenum-binding subunit
MAERTVAWKPRNENKIFGTAVDRIDGVEKATGYAKYSTDVNAAGTLFGRMAASPHAHAVIKSIDIEPAKKVAGVKAVYVLPGRAPGFEVSYEGQPIAAVAAETSGQAAEGLAAIKIEYEVLEHFVDEFDLAQGVELGRAKPQRAAEAGNLGEALAAADTVHRGFYGIHTISHACLEPHGSHAHWQESGELVVHLSTQNVSGTAGQYTMPLGIDASKVTVNCEYIGGGFGCKFEVGEWGVACAALSREAGKPVRLHLDRATELKSPGTRPSGFIDVTIASDADGKITAWDSHHWGTNGPGGGTVGAVPYVFNPPNRRIQVTGLATNCGPNKAWRAPNHPQACALTDTAIDDLAAALKKDPFDVFKTNLSIVEKAVSAEVYAAEMDIAAQLMDWKALWKPRGTWTEGNEKHGLGMALHTWGGGAHASNCTIRVNPDGTVETYCGTQDIGTGTRTVIAVTLAETFGLPLSRIKLHIGSNKYPTSGPSGGSTTVGGVSGPHRRAGLEALWKVFDLVAAKYSVDAATLAAVDGKIVSGEKTVCSWEDAARLTGPMGLEVAGEGPKNDGLTSVQVGGVQMAHVAVDPETGKVRIVKYVAVQDIGTIISRKTAESQVLGAMIMCIAYALSEERIMDNLTGRYINANLKDYKLPRIGDIGELVVEFYEPDSEYNRGVVGLGEPPVISGGAAISNAVANALGKRIPVLPLTPKRVLDTLRA